MTSIKAKGEISYALSLPDPFIMVGHPFQYYPKGNEKMAPKTLEGKDIRWKMYHGSEIPGFPYHPHRGFETITYVKQGIVDHSDSMGSKGRYAEGDVQWLTAGKGINHCEMFPLIHEDHENTLEIFQIWLNLDSKNKFVKPSYKMIWNEDIPQLEVGLDHNQAIVRVLAGQYAGIPGGEPNEYSWAKDPSHHFSLLSFFLEKGSSVKLYSVTDTLTRVIFFYEGTEVSINGETLKSNSYAVLKGEDEIVIKNQNLQDVANFLILESEPIGEPIVAHGPFVMNTQQEIIEAIQDYQKTQFGGWPYSRPDPVNLKNSQRFAEYANGKIDYPRFDSNISTQKIEQHELEKTYYNQ